MGTCPLPKVEEKQLCPWSLEHHTGYLAKVPISPLHSFRELTAQLPLLKADAQICAPALAPPDSPTLSSEGVLAFLFEVLLPP